MTAHDHDARYTDQGRFDWQIWQLADRENRGFLTPAGFGIVLRLIGHAQAGREPTHDVALQPGPLPRFDGFAPTAPIQAQVTGGGGGTRIPPLTHEKVSQYSSLFERQNLQGNQLPGDQARSIFDRSGLPNETLGRIWGLADTEQRGALVQTEFVIAMHLLTSIKSGALRALPNAIPAGLYEAATGRAPSRQSPRGSNAGLPRQVTSAAQQRTGSPLGRSAQAGSDWLVTPADKTRFDQLYATLDKSNKGYITGEEAVSFFGQSSLSEDALAQIWDLSDINSHGQLTREEFAVAMYLIRQQRMNPAAPVPATLPHNLVPPGMRNQSRQPPVSSPFDPPPMKQPPPPQPKSAMEDLFGLDSSSPPPAPRQNTMSTGGSGSDPFAGGSAIQTPSSPAGANAKFAPFVPTSTFGRGLTTQPSDSAPATSQLSTSEDLLADSEPEASKKITGESTELANLSHQIGTLSKQMQDVQSKRTTTQNDLAQTISQKQNFEQRLAQLRQLYEKEAQDTRSLEEQLRSSRDETKKLQGECLTLEGNLRDVQTQHQQVLSALQSDQQENTALREKIRVANAQITQLKPQIEKLKLEARQQKGLVAINKKQLLTTEGERDKLKTEAEGLGKGSTDDLARQGDSTAASNTPQRVASPALSTGSGNNPFFKRTASTDMLGVFAAPGKNSTPDSNMDEVFGPTGAQPPPPVQAENTGTSTASVGSFSNTPGSTPAMSRQATLRSENPPAPPESRQISSSFLPFPDQTESLSSSRQVSPPASRAEDSVTDAPSSASGKAPEVPAEKAEEPAATKHEEAVQEPEAEAKDADKQAAFGHGDKDKAKADFDSAFAAFTSSKGNTAAPGTTTKSTSAFDTEFPPISEIEREESDTESEPDGFDDDFTPASPEAKNKGAATEETSDKGKETASGDASKRYDELTWRMTACIEMRADSIPQRRTAVIASYSDQCQCRPNSRRHFWTGPDCDDFKHGETCSVQGCF